MADLKNSRYIVKHVDGVMHLIANPQGNVIPEATALRGAPNVVEKTEQKK